MEGRIGNSGIGKYEKGEKDRDRQAICFGPTPVPKQGDAVLGITSKTDTGFRGGSFMGYWNLLLL